MRSCSTGVPWGRNLRSLVFQQAGGLALPTANPSAWWTLKSMEEEERRERRRRQRQQVVNCCKQLAAFLFSHIGLAAMVVAYSIMGGFLFRAIESPAETQVKLNVIRYKEARIVEILDAVRLVCGGTARVDGAPRVVLDVEGLNETLKRVFADFQLEVKDAVKEMGWDGNDDMDQSALQWSLAGAILYAVTVITTIGYGHIAPKTTQGRMLTILYALIGIPLTFLYLSNIGNFLADCFRLFYKRICCDIICCQKCERKRKRERLKLRRRRELAAQRNILLGMHSELLADLPQGFLDGDGDGEGDYRWQQSEADCDRRVKESPEALGAVGGAPVGDDNPGFSWESSPHCDDPCGRSSADETFPHHASYPSVTSSDRTHDESEDDYDNKELEEVEEEEDEVEEEEEASESTISSMDRESVETVRETAIIEDESNHDRRGKPIVRETDIVDDTGEYPSSSSRSHRSAVHPRGDRGSNMRARSRTRTPSFHNGFHLIDTARETDLIRGDFGVEGRDSRHHSRRDFQRRNSNPFFHDPSSGDKPGSSRCPASAGVTRNPSRSLTVRADPFTPTRQPVEYRRQGQSVPSRTEQNKRSVSIDRWRLMFAGASGVASKTSPSSAGAKPTTTSPTAAVRDPQDRAKANWKKLIEYTKQLAEKERLERTGRVTEAPGKKKRGKTTPDRKSNDPVPEARKRRSETTELAKRSLMSRRIPAGVDDSNEERRTKHIRVNIPERKFSADSWNPPDSTVGTTSQGRRIVRSPFHRSEESFVTAVDDSRSSDGDGTEAGSLDDDDDHHSGGRLCGRSKNHRVHSLNSVTIDMGGSPSDDPDFQDYMQDHPMSFLDDPFDYEEEEEQEGKVTVPISICLIIISGYLFAGSALFAVWEQWDLWTGSYFCFITLSTIGFGDIVPGTDMKEWASEAKLVLCALWLAFGLSLLAMCFNLMQEEVKDKCKWIGQKLGILKDEGQT